MKILTWNINGIRAIKGKTTKKLLDSLHADIICFQETKVTRDMLDEPTAIVEGYDSYFSFSRKRTGYSGTANYCSYKTAPVKAEEGLSGRYSSENDSIIKCYGNADSYSDEDLHALDSEGRCIITQHHIRLSDNSVKDVAIINVYVPRAGDRDDRLQFKLKFLTLLQSRAEALLRQKLHVIILGDLNLFHTKMDLCDPLEESDFTTRPSRKWMDQMLQKCERDPNLSAVERRLSEVSLPGLEGGHFSDVYRSLHPDQECAFTNWCTSRDARRANYGRRLDYILVDTELAQHVVSCDIMAEVEGSDHCPVIVTLNCEPVLSSTCPLLCSKFLPEFKGQQQKLSLFFTKTAKQEYKSEEFQEAEMISSSPEDAVSSSLLKKSESLPSNSPVSKESLKGNVSSGAKSNSTGTFHEKATLKRATSAVNKGSNKKAKTKQDDTGSKQISLTSFFTKVGTSKETIAKKDSNPALDANPVSRKVGKIGNGGKSSDSVTSPHESDSGKSPSCDNSDVTIIPSGSYHGSLDSLSCSSSQQSDASVPSSEDAEFPNGITNAASSTTITTTTIIVKNTPAVTTTTNSVTTAASTTSSQAWKSLLKGPAPPPLCPGHKEPCVLKTVNKKGPNKNKQFYMCNRPEGAPGNPEFRCNYFRWLNEKKKKT